MVEQLTHGTICFIDDVLGGVTLATHGGGIMQTYDFIVQEQLKRGSLVELLPEFRGGSRPFSLLYSNNRHKPARVKVLIDFLVAHLTQQKTPH